MKRRMRGFEIGLAVAIAMFGVCGTGAAGPHQSPAEGGGGNAGNPGVIPPGANAGGKSYAQWSAEWWKWALSVPTASNPILDATGASCGINQSGPVWFLAGTVQPSVTRECDVPAGKMILFPIINVEIDYPCAFPACAAPPAPLDPACLTQAAADFANSVTQLAAEIDGKALANLPRYRAASGMFFTAADASLANSFDSCITGTRQAFASDGYWVMLTPLASGAHTIHFAAQGTFLGSRFTQDVTYHLQVSGKTAPAAATAATPQTWGTVKAIYR